MHSRALLIMTAMLVLCCGVYMTLGARAGWGFILPFRGTKLLALLTVAVAISTATVMFQSITNNRILTPSIMGFDALYILILTLAVHGLGGFFVADLPPVLVFIGNTVVMIAASLILFGTLVLGPRQDLIRMILTGVILGTLFRSLTEFLQRLIDPNEYAVVQVASYARFNTIDTDILGMALLVTLAALVAAWRMRFTLDVLSLGRDVAISQGVEPRRGYIEALVVISVLVSVATAFVGPVVFLGLLVAAIAHLVTPSAQHAVLLPSAALVSMITLVGGQTLLERVFRLTTPLSVIIDVVGGVVFLALLLRRLRR